MTTVVSSNLNDSMTRCSPKVSLALAKGKHIGIQVPLGHALFSSCNVPHKYIGQLLGSSPPC